MFSSIMSRVLLPAGLAAAALFSAGNAAAFSMGPPQTTYYFTGACADCTLTAPPTIGTLVLEGYTAGDAITETNFVAFAYHGSDLIDAFTLTRASSTPFLGVGTQYTFMPELSDTVSGALPQSGGAAAFRISFGDVIGFESTTAGEWFACAPNADHYYGGGASCDLFHHNDVGTGGWSTTAVPEPASYALMGLGMLGLAALRRRGAR